MDEIGDDKTRPDAGENVQSDLFENMDDLESTDLVLVEEPSNDFIGPIQQTLEEKVRGILRAKMSKARVGKDTIELLTNALVAEFRENKDSPPMKPGEAWAKYNQQLNEYAGRLLFDGFRNKTMPLPLFYIYPEKWADVCAAEDYPLQQKALDILRNHTGDMLDIVTPENAETLRIYDFGVGTGQKGEIIIKKAIEKNGRHIEYHGVDASEDMLRIALEKIAKNIMQEALNLKKASKRTRRTSKWRDLINFLKKHDLKYSSQPEWLNRVFKRIFENHCKNPEEIDLLRFLFARMVSLHKKNIKGKGKAKINELDDEVKLPLSISAHAKWFQKLEHEEFTPEEKEGVVIFDLGSEVCNHFPDESLAMLRDLLSEPVTPDHPEGLVPIKEEKNVHATYVVIGLQLGEIPTSQRHFREIRTQMRRAYNNAAFRALTAHPFSRKDIKYIDSTTQKEVQIEDIGFIYVDYEEDTDHPGYYGSTHRLYITEDVTVYNAKAGTEGTLHLAGKDRASDVFKRTVEALFDPKREKEVKGRRNEILRSFGISTKEELLAIDLKLFFSRDYSHYRSGMHIAEDILGKPNDFEQTLLYPSYKPSLDQIMKLCHEQGLKIIAIYADDEKNPTYVKILTRKMTVAEKDLYKTDPKNTDIFFIPDIETSNITNSGQRNESKARHTAPKKARSSRAKKTVSPKCA